MEHLLSRFSFTNRIPRTAASWFEIFGAFSTFKLLIRTAINDLIPHQIQSYITSKLGAFFSNSINEQQVYLKISQLCNENRSRNEVYYAVHKYLPTRITQTYESLKLSKPLYCENNLLELGVDTSQEVVDEFEGINFTWILLYDKDNKEYEKGPQFTLSFNHKHREKALGDYIPHVLRTYEAMKTEQRVVKIYSMQEGPYDWNESELSHPATFDTLALDPDLQLEIIDDLDLFRKKKELYKKMGKPWKRGYLLYGPPGTGKSSLVAAIANYLKFDVYNLDLASVYSNSQLMETMRGISNSSIIVIEDIDCNKEVHTRSLADSAEKKDNDDKIERKVTLSGLLNCMDGLWSSCGEERIVIFTTNHKDKIDPALLRPGRMDKQFKVSFLRGKAFRKLAFNYSGTEQDHPLFEEIDELLEKIEVTPAQVAELLLSNEDPDLAFQGLVQFLKKKEAADSDSKTGPTPDGVEALHTPKKSTSYTKFLKFNYLF